MPILSESEISNIKVKRIAFHQVGGNGAVVHHHEPTPTQLASGFFAERIRSVCVGSEFRFTGNTAVRNYTKSLLGSPNTFLSDSRALASSFHDLHNTQMRVGNFMVFLLKTGNLRLVALMKYDNQEVVRTLLGANNRYKFEKLDSAFVKDRDAIQKSAVIRIGSLGDGELVVTDRSQRGGLVTRYFKEFLGAVPIREPRECTRIVYDEARSILREMAKQQQLPVSKQRELSARMRNALVDGVIVDTTDPTALVSAMALPELSVDDALEELEKALKRQQIYGESFVIDTSDVPAASPRRVETVEGVRVFAPPEASSRVRVSPDGTLITISTTGVISDDGGSTPPP